MTQNLSIAIGRQNYLRLQKCQALLNLLLLILVHGGGLYLCSSGFNRRVSTAEFQPPTFLDLDFYENFKYLPACK
ncbi:hypothetical protein [Tychonema sp. BBK16]|uniref:hypothetical protein n=1 Tax=Tychonema sp. BBK16 TaxID=2699888 RepID=UPI0038D2B5DD